MPKIGSDGREYIEQDGKRYYRNFWGEWEAEKDFWGHDKVDTDIFGNPKIETDWLGNQKVERDWLGNPYVEPEKKDDSGCYLTTACLRALKENFDDGCDELMTLRHYRDTFVRSKYPDSIARYYEMAPRIIEQIKKHDNHQAIFEKIYAELVCQTVCLVKEGRLEDAFILYSTYSKNLEDAYCCV